MTVSPAPRTARRTPSSAARSSGSAKPALIVASASAVVALQVRGPGRIQLCEPRRGERLRRSEQQADRRRVRSGRTRQRRDGTSTGGVRMPPSAIPSALRRTWGVAPGATSIGARWPAPGRSVSQVVSARSAALATMCMGPLLIGTPQSMYSALGADEVGVGVRGAGDLPEPEAVGVGLARRVGVEDARHVGLGLDVEHGRVLIGAEDRRRAADRAGDVGVLARRDERSPTAPRLCTKKPSKAWVSGCTPL